MKHRGLCDAKLSMTDIRLLAANIAWAFEEGSAAEDCREANTEAFKTTKDNALTNVCFALFGYDSPEAHEFMRVGYLKQRTLKKYMFTGGLK